MTHTASHIIIQSLKTPVSANGKIKVWHYVAALCAILYLAGYLIGKF